AFEIIDAIASGRDARSAVEVSLSPTMERNFASVYKGVERTRFDPAGISSLLVRTAEAVGTLLFDGWAVYALDHSPSPRPSAPTVRDRGFVHGADGVVVGHRYSLLGRVMFESGSWVGITDNRRIETHQTPNSVGASQLQDLKAESNLPVIVSADAGHVTDAGLDQADERMRMLVRLKGNRKLFRAPKAKAPGSRGAKEKPTPDGKLPTPGRVQRDYFRIFSEVGSPASSPKVRGIAPGRPKGFRPQPRTRFTVVHKGQKAAQTT